MSLSSNVFGGFMDEVLAAASSSSISGSSVAGSSSHAASVINCLSGLSGAGSSSVIERRNRNPNWTDSEINTFLELLQEDEMLKDLVSQRTRQVFQRISERLTKEDGTGKTWDQCRIKLKNLKSQYRYIKERIPSIEFMDFENENALKELLKECSSRGISPTSVKHIRYLRSFLYQLENYRNKISNTHSNSSLTVFLSQGSSPTSANNVTKEHQETAHSIIENDISKLQASKQMTTTSPCSINSSTSTHPSLATLTPILGSHLNVGSSSSNQLRLAKVFPQQQQNKVNSQQSPLQTVINAAVSSTKKRSIPPPPRSHPTTPSSSVGSSIRNQDLIDVLCRESPPVKISKVVSGGGGGDHHIRKMNNSVTHSPLLLSSSSSTNVSSLADDALNSVSEEHGQRYIEQFNQEMMDRFLTQQKMMQSKLREWEGERQKQLESFMNKWKQETREMEKEMFTMFVKVMSECNQAMSSLLKLNSVAALTRSRTHDTHQRSHHSHSQENLNNHLFSRGDESSSIHSRSSSPPNTADHPVSIISTPSLASIWLNTNSNDGNVADAQQQNAAETLRSLSDVLRHGQHITGDQEDEGEEEEEEGDLGVDEDQEEETLENSNSGSLDMERFQRPSPPSSCALNKGQNVIEEHHSQSDDDEDCQDDFDE